MASTTGRASANSINNSAQALFNMTWANMSPEARSALPMYTEAGQLPKIGEIISGNFGIWNDWVQALVNKAARQYIGQGHFVNQFEVLNQGDFGYGGFIEDAFVEEAELRDFDMHKGPSRELQRTPSRVRSAFYTVNFKGQYVAPTINEAHAISAFTGDEAMLGFFQMLTGSMANSWMADDRDLHLYLFLNALFRGGIRQDTYTSAVDNATDTRNLAKKIKGLAGRMTGGNRRDFNVEGVKTATRSEDLIFITDSETMADLHVELYSPAFQLEYALMPGNIIVVDEYNGIDWPHFAKYIAATGAMTEFSNAQKTFLGSGKLRGFLFDRNFVQSRLQRLSTRTTPVNNSEDINAWLNVFKSYAARPWANATAIVSETWDLSANLTFTVTDVAVRGGYTQVVLTAPETGLLFQFVTDDAANTDVTISSDGVILGESTATITPKIETGGSVKTGAAIDLSTVSVGDTVTFA